MSTNKIIAKIPDEIIANKIISLRNKKVMIDSDLAKLYGVTTKRLNEQVKRNLKRFPDDFMFRITKDELDKIILNFAFACRFQFDVDMTICFTFKLVYLLIV